MKLITEMSYEFELHEDSKTKDMFAVGIFSSAELKNNNKRVYRKNLLEREVEKVQEKVEKKTESNLNHKDKHSFEIQKAEVSNTINEVLSMKQDQLKKNIIKILRTRPNHSCVKDALPSFILKDLNVISRGNPRKEFTRKVNNILRFMEKESTIRIYKSKNIRVQLIKSDNQKQLNLFG